MTKAMEERMKLYPKELLEEIKLQAEKEERQRIKVLNGMMTETTKSVIEEALESGASPASIATKCLGLIQTNNHKSAVARKKMSVVECLASAFQRKHPKKP